MVPAPRALPKDPDTMQQASLTQTRSRRRQPADREEQIAVADGERACLDAQNPAGQSMWDATWVRTREISSGLGPKVLELGQPNAPRSPPPAAPSPPSPSRQQQPASPAWPPAAQAGAAVDVNPQLPTPPSQATASAPPASPTTASAATPQTTIPQAAPASPAAAAPGAAQAFGAAHAALPPTTTAAPAEVPAAPAASPQVCIRPACLRTRLRAHRAVAAVLRLPLPPHQLAWS